MMCRELRDREALADRRQRGHGRVDPALALHPVALDARRTGRTCARLRRRRATPAGTDDRGRAGPAACDRDRLRLLAVVAGRVRDDADGDRERDAGADHRGQEPGLAPGALLIRHSRILHTAGRRAQSVLRRELRCLNPPVPRVPLLSGTRLVVASAPADARVLRPPAPGRATDVEAATNEALRFPLDGEPLEALAARRGAGDDRGRAARAARRQRAGRSARRCAIAAVIEALEELGVPTEHQTLLVAGGLARRASRARDRGARHAGVRAAAFTAGWWCTTPPTRTSPGSLPTRPGYASRRELVETDLVVVVSAAETRPARRARDAARRRRRRDAAARDGGVAARDARLGGLAARDARRARAGGRRAALRRLARPQPPAVRGRPPRLSVRRRRRPSASPARRCGAPSRPRRSPVRRRVLRVAPRRRGRRRPCSPGRRRSRMPRRYSARSSCAARRSTSPSTRS